jgi:hypothetical protein
LGRISLIIIRLILSLHARTHEGDLPMFTFSFLKRWSLHAHTREGFVLNIHLDIENGASTRTRARGTMFKSAKFADLNIEAPRAHARGVGRENLCAMAHMRLHARTREGLGGRICAPWRT